MKDQESFKPYIPAEKITAEMTATSVIMGIILSENILTASAVILGDSLTTFLSKRQMEVLRI